MEPPQDPRGVGGPESASRPGDQPRQPAHAPRDIIEGAGPAATSLSRPAVLGRAHDESGRRESLSERAGVLAAILGPPETAMQKYGERNPRAGPATGTDGHWRQMDIS